MMESFLGRREWKKEVSSKKWIISGKVIFLWEKPGGGKGGVYQADYLPSTDQVIPDLLVKSHIPWRS